MEIHRLDLKAYDAIIFIELVEDTGVKNDFMEYLGVTCDNIGYIKIPIAGEHSNDYYVMTIAHYLARIMGAGLKLDQHGFPTFPTGYAEPNTSQRFPQTKAELMGCYVPTGNFNVQRINTLDDAIIGPHTAYEMGWISHSSMETAYVAPVQ